MVISGWKSEVFGTSHRRPSAKYPAESARLPLRRICVVIALWSITAPVIAADGAPVDKAITIEHQAQQEALESQRRIDALADETEELAARYQSTATELDNLRAYNDQVEKLVASQEREAQSLDRQLKNIDVTERQILPLIQRMVTTLGSFIKRDLPFLSDEREQRLDQLHAMINDDSVPIAEKYRRVMKAYQTELDYGHDVAAYRGKLTLSGTEQQVDFLRIGRVALLYRTLDGRSSGYWDSARRQWVSAGGKYSRDVAAGLAIARSEAAPDLINVPVPAPAPESGHD